MGFGGPGTLEKTTEWREAGLVGPPAGSSRSHPVPGRKLCVVQTLSSLAWFATADVYGLWERRGAAAGCWRVRYR